MSAEIFYYVIVAAILGVCIILMIGLGGFMTGGDFNRKYANKLMRFRIVGQAVAVLLILAYVAVFGRNGG